MGGEKPAGGSTFESRGKLLGCFVDQTSERWTTSMVREKDKTQLLKEALLGRTRKLEATAGREPDLDALRREEREPDAVVPFFCTGCGTMLSVNARGARALSTAAGETPESYAGRYFKVGHCIACADDFGHVRLEALE